MSDKRFLMLSNCLHSYHWEGKKSSTAQRKKLLLIKEVFFLVGLLVLHVPGVSHAIMAGLPVCWSQPAVPLVLPSPAWSAPPSEHFLAFSKDNSGPNRGLLERHALWYLEGKPANFCHNTTIMSHLYLSNRNSFPTMDMIKKKIFSYYHYFTNNILS